MTSSSMMPPVWMAITTMITRRARYSTSMAEKVSASARLFPAGTPLSSFTVVRSRLLSSLLFAAVWLSIRLTVLCSASSIPHPVRRRRAVSFSMAVMVMILSLVRMVTTPSMPMVVLTSSMAAIRSALPIQPAMTLSMAVAATTASSVNAMP